MVLKFKPVTVIMSHEEESAMSTSEVTSKSLLNFVLLLFGLSIPLWVIGAIHDDVEVFPGLKLFQMPLAMPSAAASILIYRESGRPGVAALLRRAYDFRAIKPRIWYLPILLLLPTFGFLDYWIQRMMGVYLPTLHVSLARLAGYSPVFFMTYAEELGLTGYAVDRLQHCCSALTSGVLSGLIWASYHVPGFAISGYYSFEWMFWHAIYTVATRVMFVWVYNNSGRSLFSMALMHTTFGVFWTLLPATENLQEATPYYDPRIAALVAVACAAIVTSLWGSATLAQLSDARPGAPRAVDKIRPAKRGSAARGRRIAKGDALHRTSSAGFVLGGILIGASGLLMPHASAPTSDLREMLAPMGEHRDRAIVASLCGMAGFWMTLIGMSGIHLSLAENPVKDGPWSHLGFYFALMGTTLWTVCLALDISAAHAVENWLTVPTEGKNAAWGTVAALAAFGCGILPATWIVYWLALGFLSTAMLDSDVYPRWFGRAGMVASVPTIALGVVQAFSPRTILLTMIFSVLMALTALWYITIGIWVARRAW
jgi:membrane protease YdiL (CAAX protease family)